MLAYGFGDPIVRELRECDRRVGIEYLHSGRGLRQQVHVDVVLVHDFEAPRIEVQELRQPCVRRVGRCVVNLLQQLHVEVVPRAASELRIALGNFRDTARLFGGDLLHARSAGTVLRACVVRFAGGERGGGDHRHAADDFSSINQEVPFAATAVMGSVHPRPLGAQAAFALSPYARRPASCRTCRPG